MHNNTTGFHYNNTYMQYIQLVINAKICLPLLYKLDRSLVHRPMRFQNFRGIEALTVQA